jgi:DNA-binding SARP family transcriptional activator
VGTSNAETMRFRLLGGMAASTAAGELPCPPRRLHGLLAMLLLEPGPHHRDALAASLRGDLPLPEARKRLSHLLWVLRRALPALRIDVDSNTVGIHPANRAVDVEDFRRAAAGSSLAAWRLAHRLYGGDLLPGCRSEWVARRREDLRQELVGLAHRACPALLAAGTAEEARQLAAAARAIAPLDEGVARSLVQAYEDLGQPHRAAEIAITLQADLTRAGVPAEPARSGWTDRSTWADGGVPDLSAARAEVEALREGGSSERAAAALLDADLALAAGEDDFAAGLLAHADGLAVRVRKAAIARRQGDLDEARTIASAVAVEAEQEDDAAMRCAALIELAWIGSSWGDVTAASTADSAVALARRAQSSPLRCRALLARGEEELRQGQLDRAWRTLTAALEGAERQSLPFEHGEASTLLAEISCRAGQLGEALQRHRTARRAWEQLAQARGTAVALLSSAHTHARSGYHAEAVNAVKSAVSMLMTMREPPALLLAEAQLRIGFISLDRSDEDALTVLELCRHPGLVASSERHGGQQARLAVLRGTALKLLGHYEDARAELSRGRAIHERRAEHTAVPPILAVDALALLAQGRRAQADATASEALTLWATRSQELDIAPLIYYARGAVHLAQGRTAEGERMLQRGRAVLNRIVATAPPGMAAAIAHRDPYCRALMAATRQSTVVH